jgi:hypothetical protein
MSTLPVNIPFTDAGGKIDYRWLKFLQGLTVPGGGGGGDGPFVTDGTAAIDPMTVYQGPDASKGAATPGGIYFALDTRKIYGVVGGQWVLLSEELTGDVTKPAGSSVTSLANVFLSPGTYGSASQTPVLTVDSKGRVTNLWFETITASASAGGSNGSLQFNSGGTIDGAAQIFYNPVTGGLVFSNPTPTREALSPLTTKGDIFVRNATVSTRLPVGANSRYLRANSATATGLEWADDNTIEVRFNFGDASPKPITTVPANRVIRTVSITLITAFDDVAATLSVSPPLLEVTDVLPSVIGTYSTTPGVQFGSPTLVELFITPGTSTQGSGLVSISLEE